MLAYPLIEPSSRNKFQRVIGTFGGQRPGLLVICIGGIHGNEPAGVIALRNVLDCLRQTRPHFNGRLVALSGNVRALNKGSRYLERDLNRMWLPENVLKLKTTPWLVTHQPEEIEQRELLAEIEMAIRQASGEVAVLDLHTTSSEGAPFTIISDTLINRRIASQFGVPIILGLEENLDGTILNYINELGLAAIGFEAGQHLSPNSIRNHEAVIWMTLISMGCIAPESAPDQVELRKRLRQAAGNLPHILEMRHRHAIQPADNFRMRPGFVNFHPVTHNQIVARDQRGDIHVQEDGYLFMPLYQKQGDDGFFVVRAVKPFWLKVSAWARHHKLDKLLPLLPGVQRIPGHQQSLEINTHIARWFVLEICHLLGFRKHSERNGKLIVSRRKQTRED